MSLKRRSSSICDGNQKRIYIYLILINFFHAMQKWTQNVCKKNATKQQEKHYIILRIKFPSLTQNKINHIVPLRPQKWRTFLRKETTREQWQFWSSTGIYLSIDLSIYLSIPPSMYLPGCILPSPAEVVDTVAGLAVPDAGDELAQLRPDDPQAQLILRTEFE